MRSYKCDICGYYEEENYRIKLSTDFGYLWELDLCKNHFEEIEKYLENKKKGAI